MWRFYTKVLINKFVLYATQMQLITQTVACPMQSLHIPRKARRFIKEQPEIYSIR